MAIAWRLMLLVTVSAEPERLLTESDASPAHAGTDRVFTCFQSECVVRALDSCKLAICCNTQGGFCALGAAASGCFITNGPKMLVIKLTYDGNKFDIPGGQGAAALVFQMSWMLLFFLKLYIF